MGCKQSFAKPGYAGDINGDIFIGISCKDCSDMKGQYDDITGVAYINPGKNTVLCHDCFAKTPRQSRQGFSRCTSLGAVYETTYAYVDKNRDGGVTADELLEELIAQGASGDMAREMVAKADANGSGNITLNEWKRFLYDTAVKGKAPEGASAWD